MKFVESINPRADRDVLDRAPDFICVNDPVIIVYWLLRSRTIWTFDICHW